MIKNYWQHDEMLTYRILEDYTEGVYQLSLASRKGGFYVTRVLKRPDLKNKLLYYWEEDTTFATLNRAKIKKSMQDADHFNATQKPGHKEINYHCIMRRNERQRPVLYVAEKVKCSQDWLVLKFMCICVISFHDGIMLWIFIVFWQKGDSLKIRKSTWGQKW